MLTLGTSFPCALCGNLKRTSRSSSSISHYCAPQLPQTFSKCNQTTWLTLLAVLPVAVDSVTEVEAIEVAVIEEVDEDPDAVVTSQRRRNGSQSPNWADLSRPERSR